jgi:hypothetical protein
MGIGWIWGKGGRGGCLEQSEYLERRNKDVGRVFILRLYPSSTVLIANKFFLSEEMPDQSG